jgi:hypothetical protein
MYHSAYHNGVPELCLVELSQTAIVWVIARKVVTLLKDRKVLLINYQVESLLFLC